MRGRLLIVHQDDRLFWSHRRGLVRAAVGAGWDVHLAGPDSGWSAELAALGAEVHRLPLRRSWSPAQSRQSRRALGELVSSLRPDVAQTINLRTTLMAGPVLTTAEIPCVFLIAGLGLTGKYAPKWVAARLSKLFSHPNTRAQVQNSSDAEFLSTHCECESARITTLAGTGVDLQRFLVKPLPGGKPVVLFAGRLLRNKGVGLLLKASKKIRTPHQLVIAGEPDPFNPGSYSHRSIHRHCARVGARYLGYQQDMPTLLASASLVCLPSWYPEGLPRILCEAAACGRAVLATDIPGCREVVEHGESGLLIPPKDLNALVVALEDLLGNTSKDSTRLAVMGRKGRTLAKSKLETELVNKAAINDFGRLNLEYEERCSENYNKRGIANHPETIKSS